MVLYGKAELPPQPSALSDAVAPDVQLCDYPDPASSRSDSNVKFVNQELLETADLNLETSMEVQAIPR